MGHFMHTTILMVVAALSAKAYPARLQPSYGVPVQSGIQQSGSEQLSQGVPSHRLSTQESERRNDLGIGFGRPCTSDEVRNVLGECVLPEVSRNIFVYAAPKVTPTSRPIPRIPDPELHYNFVFVKTADPAQKDDPIIVPPPQQKTLVYVLSKKQEQSGNNVIQAPFTPAPRPEVFYVNYGVGDNPKLPGGVDLQTALNTAHTQGQNLNFQGQSFGGNQNQGNINSGSIVNPVSNSPINEDNLSIVGVVNGGIVNPGIASIQLAQSPDVGDFRQGGPQFLQSQVDGGFRQGGTQFPQSPVDGDFGQEGLIQQSGITAVFQSSTPSRGAHIGVQTTGASLGYSSQTPSTTFNPTQGSIIGA